MIGCDNMNKRMPAVVSTMSNSFCDFTLDIAVNKYNVYLVLLLSSIGSFIIQLIYGMIVGIKFTNGSLIYIFAYGLCILLGYIFYVMSLKKIPVALTGLIESGILFVYLIIDSFYGFITINWWFIFLFTLFIFSVFLFSYDTYKYKYLNSQKKIDLNGIFILLISIIFYGVAPYIIKMANNNGANEIAINFGYYIFAIPFFLIMLRSSKKDNSISEKNIIKYIILISLFESLYLIFGTMGYINESVIINAIIQELRVFMLFVLSFIFKNDKITINKVISIVIGILSVIGIYLY